MRFPLLAAAKIGPMFPVALMILAFLGFSGSALAAGPVDGEVGVFYWASDLESNGGLGALTSDSGDLGFRGELWVRKQYGVRAARYGADLEDLGGQDASTATVDLLWRPFSPTENNFVAVGLGWHDVDLKAIGLDGDTSGLRLVAEARFSLGGLFDAYGQGAYMPSLDDARATSPASGRFEDLSGHELEIGVSWKTAPFLSVRAGYRIQTIDFTRTGFTPAPGSPGSVDGEVETDGFLAGLTVRF